MSKLSLTITVYMIAQAVAPSFWGPLSDIKGRRVTFIGTSVNTSRQLMLTCAGTFVVYIAANMGLALSSGFVPLMVLRGLQAAGSAATISIGNVIFHPITTRLTNNRSRTDFRHCNAQ